MNHEPIHETIKRLLTIAREEQYPLLENEAGEGFIHGALYGIQWQKEQGIDWISIKDKLPEIKEKTDFGNYTAILLITDGMNVDTAKGAYFKNGPFSGWVTSSPMTPTHYAYITLPKPD